MLSKFVIASLIMLLSVSILYPEVSETKQQIKKTLIGKSWFYRPLQKARKKWHINFFKDGSYSSSQGITAYRGEPIKTQGKWDIQVVEGNIGKAYYLILENHELDKSEIVFKTEKKFILLVNNKIVNNKNSEKELLFKNRDFEEIFSGESEK